MTAGVGIETVIVTCAAGACVQVCHTRVCAAHQESTSEVEEMGAIFGVLVWNIYLRGRYGLRLESHYAKIRLIDDTT